jgi:hypothetical protein
MEGRSHLFAAGVLNYTRGYALVNIIYYEAHNPIIGKSPTVDGPRV